MAVISETSLKVTVAGVVEKMILFAQFPPESKGLAFMRWEYTPESKKVVDQWLYTPFLRNMRRVSARDEGERFLGSTLTLADIGMRAVNRDKHRLLRIDRNKNMMFYVIESIPVSKNDIYSKRIMWFSKTPSWENCLKAGVVYFDRKGFHLKNQKLRWQKVQGV